MPAAATRIFEIDDPAENDGTEFDQAWIEWTGMRGAAKRGPNFHAGEEDAEDAEGGGYDSQSEDEPGFDKASRAAVNSYGDGAGCSINGDREPNGDEDDYSR